MRICSTFGLIWCPSMRTRGLGSDQVRKSSHGGGFCSSFQLMFQSHTLCLIWLFPKMTWSQRGLISCPLHRLCSTMRIIFCPEGRKSWKASSTDQNLYKTLSNYLKKQSEIVEVKIHWFFETSGKATEFVRNTKRSELLDRDCSTKILVQSYILEIRYSNFFLRTAKDSLFVVFLQLRLWRNFSLFRHLSWCSKHLLVTIS